MSLKILFGALEDVGDSLLGFVILILIWICSLTLYLDFGGAKNINVLPVLIWGFGGCWTFLNEIWDLDFILI